ncbi:MAG: hypothetical protein ACREX9_15635 [Gammaproteobacteria bacterium]
MKRLNISNLRNNGSVERGARKQMPIALAAGMALISVHSSAFADAIPATDCHGSAQITAGVRIENVFREVVVRRIADV